MIVCKRVRERERVCEYYVRATHRRTLTPWVDDLEGAGCVCPRARSSVANVQAVVRVWYVQAMACARLSLSLSLSLSLPLSPVRVHVHPAARGGP